MERPSRLKVPSPSHSNARRGDLPPVWVDLLFDSDEPRPEAVPLVRSLGGVVNEKNPSKVFVKGHTDSWGTPVYNDDLSNRRAQAIATLLAAAGVSDGLLEVNGYGETRPVAVETHADGSHDPDGRQKNRRVEVRLR